MALYFIVAYYLLQQRRIIAQGDHDIHCHIVRESEQLQLILVDRRLAILWYEV